MNMETALKYIDIVISGNSCLGPFDERDAETENYIYSYVEAVRDLISRTYPSHRVQVGMNWGAADSIKASEDVDQDAIKGLMSDLWNYPDRWWVEAGSDSTKTQTGPVET